MSSIIYLEQSEKESLANRWKEQARSIETKLQNLKEIAQEIGEIGFSKKLNQKLSQLKSEFKALFEISHNDEIIKRLDYSFFDAQSVDGRLKDFNGYVIEAQLKLDEKILKKKENASIKIDALSEKAQKYHFDHFQKKLFLLKEKLASKNQSQAILAIKSFKDIEQAIDKEEKELLKSIKTIKEYEIIQKEKKFLQFSQTKKKDAQYSHLLKKLRRFCPKEAQRIEKLRVDLDYKIYELKITYQEEKRKFLIKQKLREIENHFKGDKNFFAKFKPKMENISVSFNQKEFFQLLFDIEEYQRKKEYAKKQANILKEQFEKLGYRFEEEIELGKVGYISNGKKEYKIRYVFHDNAEVGFNFVALTKSKNPNLYRTFPTQIRHKPLI